NTSLINNSIVSNTTKTNLSRLSTPTKQITSTLNLLAISNTTTTIATSSTNINHKTIFFYWLLLQTRPPKQYLEA
ncbi:13256_t:CDS:1, partial [Dentiscutata heterogama]